MYDDYCSVALAKTSALLFWVATASAKSTKRSSRMHSSRQTSKRLIDLLSGYYCFGHVWSCKCAQQHQHFFIFLCKFNLVSVVCMHLLQPPAPGLISVISITLYSLEQILFQLLFQRFNTKLYNHEFVLPCINL